MKLIRKFLMVAGMLVLTTGQSYSGEPPLIGGVVNFVASQGSVLVNGVPIVDFISDKNESGSQLMKLTEWLVNGPNDIELIVNSVAENGSVDLEVQDFGTGETLLTLKQESKGKQQGNINITGAPEWAWEKASPQSDKADGLSAAVTDLYAGYSMLDIDKIVSISAPFFADQEILGGMSAEMFKQRVVPMLKSGTLQPLPEVNITSHLEGKLFRVIADDGYPPIRVVIERDGMKNSMRSGEWWSMIDGAWKIVR